MDWYIVPAVIFAMVCFFCAGVNCILWGMEHSGSLKRKHARLTLLWLAGMLLCVAWPVAIPLGLFYVLAKLVQDAFPKKED